MKRTEEQTRRLKTFRRILHGYNGYTVFKVNKRVVKLDMATWLGGTLYDLVERGEKIQKGIKSCHTAACAWGIATIHPAMRRMGLQPSHEGSTFGKINGVECDDLMCDFFGLNADENVYLFMPLSYSKVANKVLPSDVAKHIDDVLAGKFR